MTVTKDTFSSRKVWLNCKLWKFKLKRSKKKGKITGENDREENKI